MKKTSKESIIPALVAIVALTGGDFTSFRYQR